MFIPPAGYPLSAYTPPKLGALARPPIILADLIDPTTGDIVSLLTGLEPTDAALQWQFTVRQGSGAALGTNGHRLHLITKGTETAPNQIKDEGRRITEKFVERGDLSDVTVEGDVVGGSTATKALEIGARNTHTSQVRKQRLGGA